MSRSRRSICIGIAAFVGGYMLVRGAAQDTPSLILLGLILLCVSLGLIISGPHTSHIAREHGRAILGAAVIARLFRSCF